MKAVAFSFPKSICAFFTPLLAFVLLAVHIEASATTKGLSQIVTPDVQDEGALSLSAQWQSVQIANPYQFQLELGLTKRLEVAVFQGFEPLETIFGAELALIQKEPYLLSVGMINWSTRGGRPQPFIEAGYYLEHAKFIAGAIQVDTRTEAVLGIAYDFNKRWRAQVDFQSGAQNFFTLGFTCNVTDNFQFNPAIYFSNNHPNVVSGYIVFTYTLPVWGHKSAEPSSGK